MFEKTQKKTRKPTLKLKAKEKGINN